MQRLSFALHGTMASYLHDALQQGNAGASCSSGLGMWDFCLLAPFGLVVFTAFSCKHVFTLELDVHVATRFVLNV
jgi:hypothetical protein